MRKALDSSDIKLVKLMVMGEGLNLNKAFAVHYIVNSCSRCNSLILRNQLFLFHLVKEEHSLSIIRLIFIHE